MTNINQLTILNWTLRGGRTPLSRRYVFNLNVRVHLYIRGITHWKNIWCNIGHVDSSATGSLLKQFLQDQLFIYSRSVIPMSWKRREGVVRRSWRSGASRGSVTQVVRASYDDRAAVPSISREGVTQQSCRMTATHSIIKVTE